MNTITTEVVIIGGGATGSSILRDCALRGLDAVLIEKHDIASGTTGRNHGLLHSGARYAVKDLASAVECMAENRILKRIARHCIEDTGGLFVTLPEDDPDYHDQLLGACRKAGIDCTEIAPREALRMEPHLNPAVVKALRVPDATIDPFRLAAANILAAAELGARVLTHTEVTGIEVRGGRAGEVRAFDRRRGEALAVRGRVVVNAAGVWGQGVLALAGVRLDMFPSKGSMVIIDYRITRVVVNRCRHPSDGDIVVPGDTVSLIGTTSREIPYDRIEELTVDDDEIEVLLADGEKMIPNVSRTRVLRAYCGVRPLIAAAGSRDGREISRGIVLIDHAGRDGLEGLVTIAGGKLMTCRLMAERATDLVGEKLGRQVPCTTHRVPLPGSETPVPPLGKVKHFSGISASVVGSTHYRHGVRAHRILKSDPEHYSLVCECEMVTRGEVAYALEELFAGDLIDLRRRTRLGMGPCQGELCAFRAAGLFTEFGRADARTATRMLVDFLEERFKGIKPVLWGDALREIEFTYWIYAGLFGLADAPRGGAETK